MISSFARMCLVPNTFDIYCIFNVKGEEFPFSYSNNMSVLNIVMK